MQRKSQVNKRQNQSQLDENQDNQSQLDLNNSQEQPQDQSFFTQSPLMKQSGVQVEIVSINKQISCDKNLIQKVHKDLQLIYIIAYCNYGKHFQNIVKNYGCGLNFVKNSYIIYCQDPQKRKQFNQCVSIINKQVNNIIYLKLDFQRKYTVLYSPYYNKVANEKGIYLCLFNNQVLIFSNKFNRSQLQNEKKKIINHYNIYIVRFIKKKTLDLLDQQVGKFYHNLLTGYYQNKFSQNVLVQVNLLKSSIYITGKAGSKPFQMMQAKNIIKTMIQGLVGVGFKHNNLTAKSQAQLIKYLQKVSKYPITYNRINQNMIILLSKDDIMRKLLIRTQQLKKRVGIDKNTSIGLYIPCCFSREQKNTQIYKICKQYSYDNWTQWSVRFFRKMISSNGQQTNHQEILQLLNQILLNFIQVKEKFEIVKIMNQKDHKIQKIKKKQLQQQNKYAYQVKNNKIDSKQLQKILKRDVLEDQLYMKKRYNVIYSILQGKQYGPFYIPRKQYDRGVAKGQIKLYKLNQLEKGQYLMVYLKTIDESIDANDYQVLSNLLIEQLQSLKLIATNQKQSYFNMDKNRKIAHMLKKLIVVL